MGEGGVYLKQKTVCYFMNRFLITYIILECSTVLRQCRNGRGCFSTLEGTDKISDWQNIVCNRFKTFRGQCIKTEILGILFNRKRRNV